MLSISPRGAERPEIHPIPLVNTGKKSMNGQRKKSLHLLRRCVLVMFMHWTDTNPLADRFAWLIDELCKAIGRGCAQARHGRCIGVGDLDPRAAAWGPVNRACRADEGRPVAGDPAERREAGFRGAAGAEVAARAVQRGCRASAGFWMDQAAAAGDGAIRGGASLPAARSGGGGADAEGTAVPARPPAAVPFAGREGARVASGRRWRGRRSPTSGDPVTRGG